jgi:hypothetical protein
VNGGFLKRNDALKSQRRSGHRNIGIPGKIIGRVISGRNELRRELAGRNSFAATRCIIDSVVLIGTTREGAHGAFGGSWGFPLGPTGHKADGLQGKGNSLIISPATATTVPFACIRFSGNFLV